MKPRVLLIDDEAAMGRMLAAVMKDHGFEVTAFTDPLQAVDAFAPEAFDVVISDVKMPGLDGLGVLERIRDASPSTPVIMISGHATVEMSIQALRKGAYDMLVKPFEPEELLRRLRNALRQRELMAENRELKDRLAARFGRLVGASRPLTAVTDTARKVAARDIPVLITGESGTGKELLAQAVHQHSGRKDRRFVAINCGAIPEALLESELFGHRRGAFTGADRDHLGLVETADGGTLFLDEIGTLPLNVQSALLRFLQEQEFYRVGDTTPRKVDVRIISATNQDMEAAIEDGSLREDLYYRLAVVRLHLPPLRDRRDDIPLLAAHFIREGNDRFGTDIKGMTPDAMQALTDNEWPGNVRQLGNVVHAAMAVEGADLLSRETLAQVMDLSKKDPAAPGGANDYHDALARFETAWLTRLLEEAEGNIDTAATLANINAATIYRKLKKYGLK